MYTTRTGLVLGFHGCDDLTVEKVLLGKEPLKKSENEYDWLGHGIYFWENSPSRALEYAAFLKNNPSRSKKPIKKPAVIGAVINLGLCLDLLDFQNLQLIKESYHVLSSGVDEVPKNKTVSTGEVRKENNLPAFDSVRGVFWEGEELYPNSGFREKDHIQLCIRNLNCIKGFFFPRELDKDFPKV